MLPSDAELQVVAIPLEVAQRIYETQTGDASGETTVVYAYDVCILSGGEKYDLEDYGDSISVKVKNLAVEQPVDVLHVKIDVTNENGALDADQLRIAETTKVEQEIVASNVEGDEAFFSLDSCSILTFTTQGEGSEGEEGDRDGEGEGGDDLLPPATIHQMILDWSDDHYLPGAEHYTSKIASDITMTTPYDADHPLRAGQLVEYSLYYGFLDPDTWGQQWNPVAAMYDSYGPSKVTLHLPKELILNDAGGGLNYDTAVQEDGSRIYTISIDPVNAAQADFFMTLKFFICGNGTEDAVRDSENPIVFPADAVTFSTQFTVVDRQKQAPSYEVKTYEQSIVMPLQNLTTVSTDQWKVTKDLTSASLTDNDTYVTFTWDVGVGLLSGTDINKNANYYSNPGRDQVDLITLTDTFTKELSKAGLTIGDPELFTIQRYDNDAPNAGANLTAGTAVTIWSSDDEFDMDSTTNLLVMDHYQSIDSDGDLNGDTWTPTYTKYKVTMKYPVDSTWIAHFPESAGYTLDVENTMAMHAELANLPDQNNSGEAGDDVTLPYTGAATLTLTKTLKDYGNNEIDYDTDQTTPKNSAIFPDYYGEIEYTLSSTAAFTVYEPDETTGFKIAKDDNGNDMTGAASYTIKTHKDYLLVPGIPYTVTENLTPKQQLVMTQYNSAAELAAMTNYTPAADSTWAVNMKNQETVYSIKITKYDDGNQTVGGATFELYFKDGATEKLVGSDTSTDAGFAFFERLPQGTYVLKETHAPTNFAVSDDSPWTINLPDDITDGTLQLKKDIHDKRLNATLTLTKYVGTAEGSNAKPAAAATYDFPGTFVLQRSLDPNATNWETVADVDSSVNVNGQIQALLPAFTDGADPQTYWYRFEETIPTGYYDPLSNKEAGQKVYTDPIQLVDSNGAATDKAVSLYNRQYIKVTVNKNFYDNNGTSNNDWNYVTGKTVDVTLYQYVEYVENGETHYTMTPVTGGAKPVGSETSGTLKTATWEGLRTWDENGRKITYLLDEAEVTGYSDGSGLTTKDVEYPAGTTKTYYVIPTTGNSSDQVTFSTLLKNYEQVVLVRAWKRDWNRPASVIPGAEITVYTDPECTHVAKNAKVAHTSNSGGNVTYDIAKDADLSGVSVVSGGTLFYLKPGQIYYFKETKVPDNTHFKALGNAALSASEYQNASNRVTGDVATTVGVIDLRNPVISEDGSAYVYHITCLNQYDPRVAIKKVSSAATGTHISNAKFAAFTKNADGKYVPYPNAGDQYVLDATNTMVSDMYFPTGTTYYFAEVQKPSDDYLDPNTNYDLYHQMDSAYVQGQVVGGRYNGRTLTFYPVTTSNNQPSAPRAENSPNYNYATFTFKNIPNRAKLKVTKYLDGEISKSVSFPITITPGVNGAESTTLNTGADGTVTFENLPVKDAQGDYITYTVTETLTGTAATTYYKVSDGQTAELTLNTTGSNVTDKDKQGNPLKVENATRVDLKARKVFRNAWQAGWTTPPAVEGATIGLFVREGDNWVLVQKEGLQNPKTSDTNGLVEFQHLERGKDYALVELASGHDNMFPWKDGSFKDYPEGGAGCTTFPNSQIGNYNALVITAEEIAVSNSGSGSGSGTGTDTDNKPQTLFDLGDVINSNHWVQFHIKKWIDATKDPVTGKYPYMDLPGTATPNASEGDSPLDNAVFELWRIVLPEGVDTVNFKETGWNYPADDELHNWKSLGVYSSGTLYTWDGERMEGEFLTDADSDINERYIYLLVEKNAGPNGGIMVPSFKYTFFHALGTDFTVTVPGYSPRDNTYEMDKVKHDDIMNTRPSGDGGGVIYLASIRIAKWRDSYNETTGQLTNDYQPLPGAQFEIRVGSPTGAVMANLTVGLDANYSGGSSSDPNDIRPSVAQTGTYLLSFNDDGTCDIYDYETEETIADNITPVTFEYTVGEGENAVTRTGYKVLVYIKETWAPDGYGYDNSWYPMWLCFLNARVGSSSGASWVFNDAYYVRNKVPNTTDPNYHEILLTDQGSQTTARVNSAYTSDSYYTGLLYKEEPSFVRIVDYPMHNTMVTVHKYGYTPTKDTLGQNSTAAHLDTLSQSAINRVSLGNVTMVIQKKNDNGGWDYWDYRENIPGEIAEAKFTTLPDGTFQFPDGLPEGTYQIWEDNLNENTAYEMAYPAGRNRVFTVTKATLHLSIYNPKKIDFTIHKTDFSGTPLTGVTFQLKQGNTVMYTGVESGENPGTYVFTNTAGSTLIDSGTYTLVESKAGYSRAYLKEYLQSVYGLGALVDGTTVGYTWSASTANVEGTDEESVISINPATGEGKPNILTGKASLELTVKNPKMTDVTLTKIDELTGNKINTAATFALYYKPFTVDFSAASNEVTVSIPDAAYTATSTSNVTTAMTGAGYYRYVSSSTYQYNTGRIYTFAEGTPDTNGLVTDTVTNASGGTAGQGVISLKNLKPGIYVFYETTAPTNYSIIKDSNNRNIFYTVVVTGGLPVTVNAPDSLKKATVKNYLPNVEGDTREITTLYAASTNGQTVGVTAENRPKVKLRATKTIATSMIGDLPSTEAWSVTFNVYSSQTTTTKFASVTITNETRQNNANNVMDITFKQTTSGNTNKAQWFVVGQDYYLEEVINSPVSANFTLGTIEFDGVTLTRLSNGRYKFRINSVDSEQVGSNSSNANYCKLKVNATNEWIYGQVDFLKLDKTYNPPQPSTAMSGAEFKICYEENGQWVKIDEAVLTEDPAHPGYYSFYFPLHSVENTTYRIYETKAPADFILDTTSYIEVQLSKENNKVTASTSLVNSKGNHINIIKYDSAYGTNYSRAGDDDAAFTLYRLTGDESTGMTWEAVETKSIKNTEGVEAQISFLTVPGVVYAIAETNYRLDKYSGIDSVWQGETELHGVELKVDGATVMLYGQPVLRYDLGASTDDVTIKVYNEKYVTPRIEKIDVGGYQGNEDNSAVKATANYAIYEIPNGELTTAATAAQVEAFIADTEHHPYLLTGKADTIDNNLANGTYGLWTTDTVTKRWNPDKSYLIVETKVGKKSGGEYNTLRKDDPRVEWFVVVPANPDSLVWQLKNVYGNATVTLTKSAVNGQAGDVTNDIRDGHVESLMTGDRKVVFDIKPTVTGKNQMLETFEVYENGLTCDVDGLDLVYKFTQIDVGGASQNVDLFGENFTATISAKVSFYTGLITADMTDEQIEAMKISGRDVVINNVESGYTVQASQIPQNARSFKITYYSQQVINKTAEGTGFHDRYSLGEVFRAQTTRVYATVTQQANGTFKNGVTPITKINNAAKTVLKYPKWSDDGSGTTPVTVKPNASASVIVDPIKLPKVMVEKNASTMTVQFGSQEYADITYTLEIKNVSDYDFDYPVLLDILPTGVDYVANSASVGTGSAQAETFDLNPEPVTVQGNPSIIFHNDEPVSEPETAVIFYLDGTLKPHSTVTLSYTARVKITATYFSGSELQNDVYLSSTSTDRYFTTDNPRGLTFTDDSGQLGDKLSDEAIERQGTAVAREGALDAALDPYSTDYYGWVSASKKVSVGNMTTVTLKKQVYGDQDAGYHDGLGTSTRTNLAATPAPTHGWVKWMLAVTNGFSQQDYIDHIVIGDVISKPGDFGDVYKNSKWETIFDHIILVYNNQETDEVPASDYTVYYYTVDTASARTAVINATSDTTQLTEANGWTTTKPSDLSTVYAFVMVFDPDYQIQKHHTLIVTYESEVVNIESNEVFDQVAFLNANNDFYSNYYYLGRPMFMRSNPVSVTLMDKPVEIQGDVWIDEDWTDLQLASGNRRPYEKYKVIQELVGLDGTPENSNVKFSIFDDRSPENSIGVRTDDTGAMSQHSGAESIQHFRFGSYQDANGVTKGGLGAARVESSPLYNGDQLNVNALSGQDPYNYHLKAEFKNASLANVFKLTGNKSPNYFHSEDPGTLTTGSVSFRDNNFLSDNGSDTSFVMKPFFIPYAAVIDQTKDIGFRMVRSLVINKVEKDTSLPIQDAKFSIYGPFDEFAGTAASGNALKFTKVSDGVYAYEGGATGVTELVTNSEGKITITGLNWWKEYVVKETYTPDQYSIAGATLTTDTQNQTDLIGRDALTGGDDNDGYQSGYAEYSVLTASATEFTFRVKLPHTQRGIANNTMSVTVANPSGTGFSFQKVGEQYAEDGSETRAPLKGIKFALFTLPEGSALTNANLVPFQQNGSNVIAESDVTGKVEFEEIPYGTYYMKEISLGDNTIFWSNETIYKVVVNHDNTVTITAESGDALLPDTDPEQTGMLVASDDPNYQGYTILNKIQRISVDGEKQWVENDDIGSVLRPEDQQVTIRLYKNKTATENLDPIQTTTASYTNSWKWSFTGLIKYSYTIDSTGTITATEINYTVDESEIPYYTFEVQNGTTSNSYIVVNTVNGALKISKVVEKDDEFATEKTFTIKVKLEKPGEGDQTVPVTGTFKLQRTVPTPVGSLQDITFDSNGEATFTIQKDETWMIYGLPKGASYTISEVPANANGWSLVSIQPDNGTIAENNTVYASTVTNTYKAEGGIVISGKKEMVGKPLGDMQFTFQLVRLDGETEIPLGDAFTVTNDGNGNFSFPEIKYYLHKEIPAGETDRNDVKVWYYRVKEIKPETNPIDGVTYAQDPVDFSVTVTDNGDGTLSAVKTQGTPAIKFINTFGAIKPVPIGGMKILHGRLLKEGEFSFQLSKGTTKLGPTVTNSADGSFDFGGIVYEIVSATDGTITLKETYKADLGGTGGTLLSTTVLKDSTTDLFVNDIYTTDFTYTVEEIVPAEANRLPGVAYTTDTQTVTVTVEYNRSTGELSVVRDPLTDLEIDFINTYEVENNIPVTGLKILRGRTLAAGEFTFKLSKGTAVLNDSVTNAADGSFDFGGFVYKIAAATDGTITLTESYKAADADSAALVSSMVVPADAFVGNIYTTTFTYTVEEIVPDPGLTGVIYNNTPHDITVTVTYDKSTGELTVTKSPALAAEIDFINTYEVENNIPVTGLKILRGRTLAAGEFTFKLSKGNEVLNDSVTNKLDGTFDFGGFVYKIANAVDGTITLTESYKAAGANSATQVSTATVDPNAFVNDVYTTTFTYTVEEIVPDDADKLPGVTYNNTPHDITVTVTYNRDTGELTVTKSPELAAEIDFINTFSAVKPIDIQGLKILHGRELDPDEFTFKLLKGDDVLNDSVTNMLDGTFDFGGFEYEIASAVDGTITLKETYKSDLSATGGTPLSTTVLKSSTVDLFENDVYTTTFEYVVEEIVPDDADKLPGVTYNNTPHTITVTVTYNKDTGEMTVTKSPETAVEIDFINTYEVSEPIDIQGLKILHGRKLNEGEFTFKLSKDDRVLNDSVTNAADGSFDFGGFEYHIAGAVDGTITLTESYKADLSGDTAEVLSTTDITGEFDGDVCTTTFEYVVEEIIPDPGLTGIGYTTETRTVTVTVSYDKSTGVLTVTKDPALAAEIDFINTYEVEKDVPANGLKILNGRELAEGEFTFKLSNDDGVLNDSVTNAADGIFDFGGFDYKIAAATDGTITLTETYKEDLSAAVGRELSTTVIKSSTVDLFDGDVFEITFDYYVEEVIPDDENKVPGVTYDPETAVFFVTVTYDRSTGELTVTKDPETAAELKLTNTYEAEGEITVEAKKTLKGETLEGGEFSFELYQADASGSAIDDPLQTVANDADGSIRFNTTDETRLNYKLTTDDDGYIVVTEYFGKTFLSTETLDSKNVFNGKDFYYLVKEYVPAEGIEGVVYSVQTFLITVTVTDNGDGTLNVVKDKELEDVEFINTPVFTHVDGLKIWDDAENQDNIRPESIQIDLLRKIKNSDDEPVSIASVTVTADEDGEFKWSFTDLPVYAPSTLNTAESMAENEYEYSFSEAEIEYPADFVAGYTVSYAEPVYEDGYWTIEVTNKHVPELVDINGLKIWDDKDNQDGVRPESITIALLADGVEIDSVTVEPDENGEFKWSFKDLPRFKAGEQGVEVVYTFSEAEIRRPAGFVAGYTVSYTEPKYNPPAVDENGELQKAYWYIEVTNKYVPELVDINGLKIWDDADDQDMIRPESITIALLADGVEIDSVTVRADENGEFKWSFENLPRFREGKQGENIVYTFSEAAITVPDVFESGYTVIYSDPVFTAPAEDENGEMQLGYWSIEVTNFHEPEAIPFSLYKLGQVAEDGKIKEVAEPLQGVEFTLYTDEACTEIAEMILVDAEGNCSKVPAVVTSDENGLVDFGQISFEITKAEDGTVSVEPKTYYLKETKLGEGSEDSYWDNDTLYTVVATPRDGETAAKVEIAVADDSAVTFEGKAYTGKLDGDKIENDLVHYEIKLVKKDYTDETKLIEGAEFDLYRAPDADPAEEAEEPEALELPTVEEVSAYSKLNTESLVTDEEGKVDLGDLLPGTYYLVETKAPDGYCKLDEPVEIIVRKGLITVSYRITLIKDGESTVVDVTKDYEQEKGEVPTIEVTIEDTPKYGNLRITKLLERFELSEDATFVFTVVGKIDGKTVYSNTAVLTCSASDPSGVMSTVLNYIPAGAEVTVTEAYSGSHYVLTSEANQTTVIEANVTVGVEFSNDYVPEEKGGHGIVNMFEPDDSDLGWHWSKSDNTPNTEAALPPPPPVRSGDEDEDGEGDDKPTDGNASGETSGGTPED